MRRLKIIRICNINNTSYDVDGYYMLESNYVEPNDIFLDSKGNEFDVIDIKEIKMRSFYPKGLKKVSCIKTNIKLNVGDVIYVDLDRYETT
jgi:hypothetical protein|tara:strand:+ start:93 stop:365 length:273 start_codon:yes stop_codon:yes gene_type:complete